MFVNVSKQLKTENTQSLSLSLTVFSEALALNKELEFAAIQAILRHLDDNHDGSVDLQESEEVSVCVCVCVCVCLCLCVHVV